MTDEQWGELLEVIDGREPDKVPVGFIVDSTWLPQWAGMSILDYYTSEPMWFRAHTKLHEAFPELMIFPGYWSEFGMFSEPSAFGTLCVWAENDLPFPEKCIHSYEAIASVSKPDVERDGMLPFMTKRLQHYREQIEAAGHRIRFAVARGPLNIATFVLGGTEFLLGLKIETGAIHRLLGVITDFLVDWLRLQKALFPSIEGCFILDDIVGFVGEDDFMAVGYPYLEQVFGALDVPVKFLHNDASAEGSARHLADLGINMFNFSFQHSLAEMREMTGGKVTLVGNIPPRDVLHLGTKEQIESWVREDLDTLDRRDRLIVSCGGGLSPGTSEENIRTFVRAAR